MPYIFDKLKAISEIVFQVEKYYRTGAVVGKGTTTATANIVVNRKLTIALEIDVSHLIAVRRHYR